MKLSSIFTSNAVLPAKKPIRIFGEGNGKCEIEFAGIKKVIVSNEETWCAEFPAMEYGGPYTITFKTEDSLVCLDEIYIGEVYLFAGQSNIAFMLSSSNTPKEKYEENEKLSLFKIPNDLSLEVSWQKARLGTIEEFSALGYLTGNEISKSNDVHVGIIQCAHGASVIDSWLPYGTLDRLGISFKEEEMHYDRFGEYGAWNGEGYLYNKMLRRMIPYSLSGVIWYQGESNAAEGEALSYEKMLRELIKIWRDDFKNENLPFTIVQIADTHERMAEGYGWRVIQEAQEKVGTTEKNAYLVISKDICETDDIHPQSKLGLAMRVSDIIKNHYFDN